MIANYAYKGINQVMGGIRTQIIDSVEYCYQNIPVMQDPSALFYYLKERTTFVHDPEDVELLQSVKTLFENNWHGKVGAGDCDCFTVLGTSCFIAQGWGDIDIVLAGRSRGNPVHIYNYITWQGTRYCFDLTEPTFNCERPYPYKQVLPIKFYK